MSEEGGGADATRTCPVSARELARLRRQRRERQGEPRITLIVYYRDGARVVPLEEGDTVVVGRSAPADIVIRDGSLSRQHACFELTEGECWIEDLESTNGTWIDGERIERRQVGVDTEIMLGAVAASIELFSPVGGESLGLISHDAFGRELDTEVLRALAYGRPLSLMMVRSLRREPGHIARWLPLVRELLDPFQRLALYSGSSIEILVPELLAEDASALGRRIIEGPHQLLVGVAELCPGARSADALQEAAREATQRATLRRPVVVAGLRSGSGLTAGGGSKGPVIESPSMKKLFATANRLASSTIPVLIQGETGSGKEVVAQAIHSGGPRKGKPMIPVNCGAIAPQLLESTLFGHDKGAFTGAAQTTKGIFEAAHGGTVLLDEVGELPLDAQTALLRVLEAKKVTRVGSTREVDVDVRVLAATHRDLEAMCEEGAFRRDLFYRLDAMAVRIPPLRDRVEEIGSLVERFLSAANVANDCAVEGISPEAMERLRRYQWPGNVRELRNALERAVVIAQGPVIEVEDLPERVRGPDSAVEDRRDREDDKDGSPVAGSDEAGIDLRAEMHRHESELILQALRRSDWRRKTAATRLGLPVRTLSHRMKVLGIRRSG